jgi:MFS family permease
MSDDAPALAPVVGVFTIAQVIAWFIPPLLNRLGIPMGFSFVVVCSAGAVAVAAFAFVKRFGRAPNSREQHILVWLSLGVSWGIWLVIMALTAAASDKPIADGLKALLTVMPLAVIAIFVVPIFAVYVGAYYLVYGWVARQFEQKLAIKP